MGKRERVTSQLCVTLPTFLVIAIRLIVTEENARRKGRRRDDPVTPSLLIETLLMRVFGNEKQTVIERFAKKSPEFKRAAEAWIRQQVARRRSTKVRRKK